MSIERKTAPIDNIKSNKSAGQSLKKEHENTIAFDILVKQAW